MEAASSAAPVAVEDLAGKATALLGGAVTEAEALAVVVLVGKEVAMWAVSSEALV
jgi:hypothetical protein